ncbi:MAG: precorrin-6y C5,15-methyltransferase (decarboxylating) subunit CbiE, partial [Nitratireductor sp.]
MSNTHWLSIIGIGDDGLDGLSAQARSALQEADKIIGGERHHSLTSEFKGERISWPSPFDVMLDVLEKSRHQKVVVLATGDPLWYSVGTRILKSIRPEEIKFFPQISAFQWASARMQWSMADCNCLTVHGREVVQILPDIAPNAKLLV